MDMDTNGLDLGKILKMVTDNPTMLQTALSFAGKLKDTAGPNQEITKDIPAPPAAPSKTSPSQREQERQLLMALRP